MPVQAFPHHKICLLHGQPPSYDGGSEALRARPDHVSYLCLAWYCMSHRESCIRIKLSIPRFSLRGMGEMEGGGGCA